MFSVYAAYSSSMDIYVYCFVCIKMLIFKPDTSEFHFGYSVQDAVFVAQMCSGQSIAIAVGKIELNTVCKQL